MMIDGWTADNLISREVLKETIEEKEGIFWDSYSPNELVVRKKYIDNAPTVEPEITNDDLQAAMTESYHLGYELAETKFKRPHGEWIKEYKDFKCSLCGKIAYSWNNHGTYIQIKSDFCPHCGADMRGEEDDN